MAHWGIALMTICLEGRCSYLLFHCSGTIFRIFQLIFSSLRHISIPSFLLSPAATKTISWPLVTLSSTTCGVSRIKFLKLFTAQTQCLPLNLTGLLFGGKSPSVWEVALLDSPLPLTGTHWDNTTVCFPPKQALKTPPNLYFSHN